MIFNLRAIPTVFNCFLHFPVFVNHAGIIPFCPVPQEGSFWVAQVERATVLDSKWEHNTKWIMTPELLRWTAHTQFCSITYPKNEKGCKYGPSEVY